MHRARIAPSRLWAFLKADRSIVRCTWGRHLNRNRPRRPRQAVLGCRYLIKLEAVVAADGAAARSELLQLAADRARICITYV